MLEGEDETGHRDGRPRAGALEVVGPREARLVLAQPARVGPGLLVADQRQPRVDDRVVLELVVGEITQRFRGEEQRWQVVAGALLLTPGFVTDGVGLLLLLPPVRAGARRILKRALLRRVVVTTTLYES